MFIDCIDTWFRMCVEFPEHGREITKALVKLLSEGKIKPHVHRVYGLEQVREAMHDVHKRRVMGKVVLITDAGKRQLKSATARISKL